MSTMRVMAAAALAVIFAVSAASAQQQTQRVAGTIDKIEGKTLYIKSANGPVTLTLTDNAVDCRPGEGDGRRHQGGRLCCQRRCSAAQRQPESSGAAHLPREHARQRRRASAWVAGRAQWHNDQRRRRPDGNRCGRPRPDGEKQERREETHRRTERASLSVWRSPTGASLNPVPPSRPAPRPSSRTAASPPAASIFGRGDGSALSDSSVLTRGGSKTALARAAEPIVTMSVRIKDPASGFCEVDMVVRAARR